MRHTWICYFKLRNRKQRSFRVWENVVLIRARDADEAARANLKAIPTLEIS